MAGLTAEQIYFINRINSGIAFKIGLGDLLNDALNDTFGDEYVVYEGGPYATIQSAIDQAVLDGYDGEDQTVVKIYPKSGVVGSSTSGYVENLTVYPGIHLYGVGGSAKVPAVYVSGSLTYAVPSGLNLDTGYVNVSNLHIKRYGASLDTITFDGTNQGRIQFTGCRLEHNNSATSNIINMTGANGELSLSMCDFAHLSTSSGTTIKSTGGGIYAGLETVFSYGKYALDLSACTFVGTGIFFTHAVSTEIIKLASSAVCVLGNSTIQNLGAAGCDGVNISSSGCVLRTVNSYFNVTTGAAGRAVRGVAGGIWQRANDVFEANDQYSTALTVLPMDTTPTAV